MTKRLTLPSPLLCLILLATLTSGQSNAPQTAQKPFAAATIKQIETVIQEEMTKQSIPGVSVAVGVNGEIRYAKGFGMADLENSVPVKATMVYRTLLHHS